MITVMGLLSNPIFQEFQLISGRGGLCNEVSGTAIFEWESSSDVEKTFNKGEFVMTTLSQAKYDSEYAENFLRTLILKGVSAIAIKTIYFKEVSEELQLFSTLHNVPIFFFSDTYFDDIIFVIKNLLLSDTSNFYNFENIKTLFNSNVNSASIKNTAKQLNPFFFNNFICCYASLNNRSLKGEESLERYYQECLKANINNPLDSSKVVCLIIKCPNGILVIYTAKELSVDLNVSFYRFLDLLQIGSKAFFTGLSNIYSGLENLGSSIKESVYANASCHIDNEPLLSFDATGLDQLLMPVSEDPWVKHYCNKFLKPITEYDAIHNSKLLETLLEYSKSNGDIQLIAKKSFQHTNTIRYRINKIKSILNIEKSVDCYPQFYVLARLYGINAILKKFINFSI